MVKTKDKNNITLERNKAVNHCLNLQSRREQLVLLIRQLQNLAKHRETNSFNYLHRDSSDQLDYLKPANSIITTELSKAIKDHDTLNKDIKNLKDKITLLNNRLKI